MDDLTGHVWDGATTNAEDSFALLLGRPSVCHG